MQVCNLPRALPHLELCQKSQPALINIHGGAERAASDTASKHEHQLQVISVACNSSGQGKQFWQFLFRCPKQLLPVPTTAFSLQKNRIQVILAL